MENKGGWVCRECGKHTHEPDKVCMFCKKGETQVQGLVDRKAVKK